MTTFEFKAICVDDLQAMTNLLSQRQFLESNMFSFLKNSQLNYSDIANKIKNLFVTKKVIGSGAFLDNVLVGYLIGELKIDSSRGRHIWVPYEGLAIHPEQSVELIRQLYAHVSMAWLEQGFFTHYTIVPLGQPIYFDAYQRLSFAIHQVYGVMELAAYQPFEHMGNAQIRRANQLDRESMEKMSTIIYDYQNAAPTFEPVFPETIADIQAGYRAIIEEKDEIVLIAERENTALGFQVYFPSIASLMTPNNSIELSIAGTYSSKMRNGIGKQLMNEGSRLMKEMGYDYLITDWRVTNLASSTFWPKCGFQPVAYRMVRSISSDIAWANFNDKALRQ